MVELLSGAFARVSQVGRAERNHDAHITQFSHLKCLSLVVTEQVMVSLLIESRARAKPTVLERRRGARGPSSVPGSAFWAYPGTSGALLSDK